MGKSEKQKKSNDHVDSSLGSILFSVFLVALAIGFVFGFKYFLTGKGFKGIKFAESQTENENEQESTQFKLEQDKSFKYEYVTVLGLNGKELYADVIPSRTDSNSLKIEEGENLKVKKRGYIDGKLYYQLDDGRYLKDHQSLLPLKEYVALKGYLSITYISSSGVHLRKWADFDADNVVGSVYVGDKVDVSAKVITLTDTVAFVTKEGKYITADSRYLNDYTRVVQEKKN